MKDEILDTTKPMSVEAYIAFEENSDIRHEFINGNLIPMPGTTDEHNEICINIVHELRNLLKQIKEIKIFQENVKVQITDDKDYTYPDVFITFDERDLENRYVKKYPVIIFEVMSKSSRVNDMVDKFIRYRNIPTLQNYVLVDSEKRFIEVRTKVKNGEWDLVTYFDDQDLIPLSALDIQIPIGAIYEQIKF